MADENKGGIREAEGAPIGAFDASLREYAVYTLDPDGIVTSWNPGAERITGCPATEIVGSGISVFHTPEQIAEGVPGALPARAAESGTSVDEGWRLRRDGTLFWAHVVTMALWASDGTLRGFTRLARDDTEAYFQLERSLRQFRDLFGLTPVGIGLFDRHGNVLDSNGALLELLGYRADEISGINAMELVHPDEPRRDEFSRVFLAGAPPGEEIQELAFLRSDGAEVRCELHATRSLDPAGEPFWLVVFQDVTEKHRQMEAWRHWATHDQVTGLPNRTAVAELFGDVDPDGVAVLCCEIDKFKRINESLGHQAGEELLVALARRLRARLPEQWMIARGTADEYLIVCPDVHAAGGVEAVTTAVADSLRIAVALAGRPVHVSASIGAAVGDDNTGTVADLVRFAGAAALRARRRGPGRMSVAGPAPTDSVDHQVELECELREAIEADSLSLVYQPIVAADMRIVTAEALLRWPHPERGLLTPDIFLPVAEREELLGEIDRLVLRNALRDAATWPARPDGGQVAVSVNLAELSPGETGFVDLLTRLVGETGIDWHRIIVELVETSLIDLDVPSRTPSTMRELVERGVRFSVDDFGTGYSQLGRLRDFPVQIIKVDRSFVAEVELGGWGFAVVRAVRDLAAALGCRCTAEGVETVGQFEALRRTGVDAYQGWLFSRAVSATELVTLIRRGRLEPGTPPV